VDGLQAAAATQTQIKTEGETDSEGGAAGLDFPRPQRWDEVQAAWERGAGGLVRLKSGLTETGGKLEEARRVVGVLDGE
jgi:hypothetical protein